MKEEQVWRKLIKKALDDDKSLQRLLKVSKGSIIKTLKRRRDKIKTLFKDNQELGKQLYKACKICVILNKRSLNLKQCVSALKAATHLLFYSEYAVQEVLDELKECLQENIKNCDRLDNAVNCWRLIKRIESSIENTLKQWNIIFNCDRKWFDKLKENLEFIRQFNQEEKVELKWIISCTVSASLKWIETETQRTKCCDIDSLIEFRNNSKKLEELIAAIREEKEKKLDEIDDTNHVLEWEIIDENDKEKSGNIFPEDFEEKRIAFDRITKMELIAFTSEFNEEQSIISTYRGILDESKPICIKIYHQKFNEPPNVFLKELNLIRNLSETSQHFLKYEGWFHELLDFNDSKKVPAFAIVTEGFACTLMDEIVNRSSQNQKYTYQEYQWIVICLLDAFSFLESREIIHNNIKPHNILIAENRTLKIAEFNFSDSFSIDNPTLYSNNADSLWKDDYMAPELIRIHKGVANKTSIDINKCNVYSLGLVFLQMYSLLPIAELNTPLFWSKIDCYVSAFKPENVANLLRKMLAENSNERPSFKESLEIFTS